MLKNVESPKRCLVLTANSELQEIIANQLNSLHLRADVVDDRKTALQYFLTIKPFVIIVDALLLPRFPFRLLQLFKIAHRDPAVVIVNTMSKNMTGFERLEGCTIRIVAPPFTAEAIHDTIESAVKKLNGKVRAVFIKNLLVQIGIVVPLAGLFLYLLLR